jgi:hypothetical protein
MDNNLLGQMSKLLVELLKKFLLILRRISTIKFKYRTYGHICKV